jgi:NAD(P)-dependent dehydrogenase (short-subunit alcohol dehydrogenase family)
VELGGRTALVTGAGAGIGRAVALALAREGASVVAVDLDEDAARESVELAGSGKALRADVANDDELRAAFAAAGRLDVLVNNAGGVSSPYFPDAPLERWSAVLDVNLRATMLGIQLALDTMRGRGGAIVNVSSIAGVGSAAHRAPEYAAAKAAVVRLTAALAPLAEHGVRVNCICPDFVDTPAARRSLDRATPKERAAAPPLVPAERVADAILGLVQDDTLAGRVLVCPATEEWRLLSPD